MKTYFYLLSFFGIVSCSLSQKERQELLLSSGDGFGRQVHIGSHREVNSSGTAQGDGEAKRVLKTENYKKKSLKNSNLKKT